MVMEGVDNRPIAMDKVAVEEIYIHGIIIIIIIIVYSSIGSVELKTPSTDDCFVTYIFAFIPIQHNNNNHNDNITWRNTLSSILRRFYNLSPHLITLDSHFIECVLNSVGFLQLNISCSALTAQKLYIFG